MHWNGFSIGRKYYFPYFLLKDFGDVHNLDIQATNFFLLL